MTKEKKLLWTALGMLVLGLLIGFFVSYLVLKKGMVPVVKVNNNNLLDTNNFSSLTATVNGKILSLNGKMMAIENNKGKKQEFEVLDQVVTLPFSAKSSTPSADLKSVQLNKEALITLIYRDQEFKVSSIMYLPNLPQVNNNLPFGKPVKSATPSSPKK